MQNKHWKLLCFIQFPYLIVCFFSTGTEDMESLLSYLPSYYALFSEDSSSQHSIMTDGQVTNAMIKVQKVTEEGLEKLKKEVSLMEDVKKSVQQKKGRKKKFIRRIFDECYIQIMIWTDFVLLQNEICLRDFRRFVLKLVCLILFHAFILSLSIPLCLLFDQAIPSFVFRMGYDITAQSELQYKSMTPVQESTGNRMSDSWLNLIGLNADFIQSTVDFHSGTFEHKISQTLSMVNSPELFGLYVMWLSNFQNHDI